MAASSEGRPRASTLGAGASVKLYELQRLRTFSKPPLDCAKIPLARISKPDEPPRPRRRSFLRNKSSWPSTHPPAVYQQQLSMRPPADSPPPYSSTPPPPPPPARSSGPKKSKSSPMLQAESPPSTYEFPRRMSVQSSSSDSDLDDREDEVIYATRTGSRKDRRTTSLGGLRNRIFSNRLPSFCRNEEEPRMICTARGAVCAGETETELDEPPKHLPTTRIVPASRPIVPPSTLEQITPFLFECCRLLAMVPAFVGTCYNLYRVYRPPGPREDGRGSPERVDFAVAAIWAILTGFQCLWITTGLLTRWRLYYPPLSTLIRLLALQGICWPATQLTCSILEHDRRPLIVWALIGTTTCVSRSLQIWVTSNLWWEIRDAVGSTAGSAEREDDGHAVVGAVVDVLENGEGKKKNSRRARGYWRTRWGGKWGGRRWDWKEVGIKCMLPSGIVYFVMAWAVVLRREFSGS